MQVQGVLAMVMVQDIERALRFYRDTLGLSVQQEAEDYVVFAEGIGLQSTPTPSAEVEFRPNAVVVTLIVPDVQATYAELITKGVAFFLPPTEAEGAVFSTFRDTENHLLQLMQIAQ